jgi:Glycosyl transferase family 11
MKTVVRISGGLGNQLFKFAHGLNYLSENQSDLIYDITWYKNQEITNKDTTKRNFELLKFPNLIDFNFKSYKPQLLHLMKSSLERRLTPTVQNLLKFETDATSNRSYVPRIVDGSFEDVRHLPSTEIIMKYLAFPKDVSVNLSSLLIESNKDRPIAIHVRRTDFLKFNYIYDVLTPNYYFSGLSIINNLVGHRPIWLFSDDPNSALHWMNNRIPIDKIVSADMLSDPVEVMQLMANSVGIVGANSTFAWWSCFFGTNQDRSLKVILPNKFSHLDEDDPVVKLRYADWIMISGY